jgi:Domain of unknown function (DUF4326)
MPDRLTHSRARGARLPEGARLVTRGTRWGNPFVVADCVPQPDFRAHPNGGPAAGLWSAHHLPDVAYNEARLTIARAAAINSFAQLCFHFARTDPDGFEAWIAPLRGRDLACSCKPGQPCHADVLLRLANEEVPRA